MMIRHLSMNEISAIGSIPVLGTGNMDVVAIKVVFMFLHKHGRNDKIL